MTAIKLNPADLDDPWFGPDQPWPAFTNVEITKSGPHTMWRIQLGTWDDGEPRVVHHVRDRVVHDQSRLESVCTHKFGFEHLFEKLPDDQWQRKIEQAEATATVIKKAKGRQIVGRRPARLRIPPTELMQRRSKLASHASNDPVLMSGVRSHLASASADGAMIGKLMANAPHLAPDGVYFTRKGLKTSLRAAGIRCKHDKLSEALEVIGARGLFKNVRNRRGVRVLLVPTKGEKGEKDNEQHRQGGLAVKSEAGSQLGETL